MLKVTILKGHLVFPRTNFNHIISKILKSKSEKTLLEIKSVDR